MATAPWVLTRSGRKIYLDGRSNEHSIEDIAFSLAHKPRYNGHTHYYYSVAQHSMLVSNHLPLGTPIIARLAALLHDAAEAYIGDMPGPAKTLCPDVRKLESVLHVDILTSLERTYIHSGGKFDLLYLYSAALDWLPAIHEVDSRLCANEMKYLFDYDLDRKPLPGITKEDIIPCMCPDEAYRRFLGMFHTYVWAYRAGSENRKPCLITTTNSPLDQSKTQRPSATTMLASGLGFPLLPPT